MILVLCSPGHVGLAVKDALETLHESWKNADASDPDLLTHALGCRAIVYVPEPRLLDAMGKIESVGRVRRVVRAAHAPGVQRVVVVEPSTWSFDAATMVLENDGVGYTIVRCPPLLDELADATNLHTARSVWLPKGRDVVLATRPALATAVRHALTSADLQGASVAVPSEPIEMAEAMRRAAAIAGADVRVHVSMPTLSFAIRKLYSWMGFAPPEVEALCDRLGSRSGRPHVPAQASA